MITKVHQRITLPNGEKTWCSGKTLSDAIGNLLARIAISQKVDVINAPTLRVYAEHWYATYHAAKVKRNTALNTRTYLNKYIYPFIGEMQLNRIKIDDVQKIFVFMANKAESTARKIKITLHAIFANALEDGYVTQNIMDSNRFVLPSAKKKRKALTKDEIKDVVEHLSCLRGNDKLLLALAIYTGMRRGEILALKWDQVDFDTSLINVCNSVVFINNNPVISSTKSQAGIRQIPLDPALREIFKEFDDKTGYIIKNHADISLPVTEKMFQRMFQRISKTIDLHGATMHIFRHTYATLRKPQCDIKTLQRILGHSDIKVTMNTYVDAIDEDIQKLSEVSMFCDNPVNGNSR